MKPTKAEERALRKLLDTVERCCTDLPKLEQARLCARALTDAYGVEYGVEPCENGTFTIAPVKR
jgi:hypothetical protein